MDKYEQEEDLSHYRAIAYAGLADFEQSVFASIKPLPKSALVWGCGTGREVFALAKHAEICHGVDISSAMLRMAREFAKDCAGAVEFYALDELPPRKYDLIWITANLTSHMATRVERIRFFRLVSGLLSPDGVVVFRPDMMNLAVGSRFWFPSQILRFRSLWNGRWWERGDTVRGYLGYPSKGLIFYHYFTEEEVRDEIRAAGLSCVKEVSSFWFLRAEKKEK